MCSATPLQIDILSLREGTTAVRGQLGGADLAAIGEGGVTGGDIAIEAEITKAGRGATLRLTARGSVDVTCDRCLDPIPTPVDIRQEASVVVGREAADDEGRITITEAEPVVDLAFLTYEAIILSLPAQRVHAPGKCNAAMLSLLQGHEAAPSGSEAGTADPRWAALAALRSE